MVHLMEVDALNGPSGEDHEMDDLMLSSMPPGEEERWSYVRSLSVGDRKRKDMHTHRDRTTIRNKEWRDQHEDLVEAYMAGKSDRRVLCLEDEDIVGIYCSVRHFYLLSPHTRTNITLARNGYLGTAPRNPTVALAFDVLEAYRQLHRVCPRLSIQGIVRVLCYLHMVPYRRVLVDQFSIAFDVYLDIIHGVDERVWSALQRDVPNWHMLNACAACLYKVDDEVPLKFSLLTTMNGNQSLKLVDNIFRVGVQRHEDRTCRTDMWISTAEVDRFKDEVCQSKEQSSSTPAPHAGHSVNDDDGLVNENDADVGGNGGDPTSICYQRWRNVGHEARKKMFALFAVTGIFVCLCRHGQLLTMCDMIRSGELQANYLSTSMKYPLAIVDKLMEVYGSDVKLGYDIACEFAKTLRSSSLGLSADLKCMSGVVPAFHGHSHNRLCQVYWHPMYMDGVGKEDFEGCERVFSESNALASRTRLSTSFHHHQAIEQFFGFWGEQKHAETGQFIFNNYKQALNIIRDSTRKLDMYEKELKTTSSDYEDYLEQEHAYLLTLKSEPPEILRKVDYMAALGNFATTSAEARATDGALSSLTQARIQCIKNCKRHVAHRGIDGGHAKSVLRIEDELQIVERWIPGMPEFDSMVVELRLRDYWLVLDKLERLVVQRLLELAKLGMSGIGYKLREKIRKALRARAVAICKALSEYNKCASELDPPRPELSWSNLMDMVSVADVDILRDARQDIRALPWAQRANRDAMNIYFNIKRVQEEIQRLNIEIARLFTWMVDEHVDYYRAIKECYLMDCSLARELSEHWQYRDKIHHCIVEWLYKASRLRGFTGKLTYGHRIGRDVDLATDIPLPSWTLYTSNRSDSDDVDHEEDEQIPGVEDEQDADNLVGFFDDLGSLPEN
ncbi:hypothetical protein A0H81_03873 [Grifola frondosa]|uniref:CxC1-like cysteine cluster associated with KDZ transposases domain-containing protein n=1 Tax=Grifola frondosa TaxID=5627 RepID=A0A1C7MJQ9_GRIFR|nr:hypothetical protein A0H81_03873 [Grifola frondosa]